MIPEDQQMDTSFKLAIQRRVCCIVGRLLRSGVLATALTDELPMVEKVFLVV